HVERAFFVNEVEGKVSTSERPRDERDPRREGSYLTALLQRDAQVQYVRLDPPPAGSEPSLLAVTEALRARGVPIRAFHLSLGANDFRVTEPNTALIYILGTVGPWLLVLAIVWF